MQFSLHVAPGVVLASIVSLVLLYFLFKSAIKREVCARTRELISVIWLKDPLHSHTKESCVKSKFGRRRRERFTKTNPRKIGMSKNRFV